MAPKCHRVTRQVVFQQATQLLSRIRYPTDTHQLTSPQGGADVRSLEGVWHRRCWGGWIHLAVDTASKGSPPLLKVRQTNTQMQDFIEGNLGESIVAKLNNYIMHNWDTKYSHELFPPYKTFHGMLIKNSIVLFFARSFNNSSCSKNWLAPLKNCFLTYPLTWCGSLSILNPVLDFRGGIKTLH